MFAHERPHIILEARQNRSPLTVPTRERLRTSPATARRDPALLESPGRIVRLPVGKSLLARENLTIRAQVHHLFTDQEFMRDERQRTAGQGPRGHIVRKWPFPLFYERSPSQPSV